ncbi:MAG: MFS transporter [Oscillospiraceae bacterium]|nr:MFS transporter [Oscillospiraceae bacterium]
MKEKLSAYRPAAAAFLTMMAMALTSSTLSFFLEPICTHLNISRGSFSMIFSLMSVSGALLNPYLGQLAGKKGVRGILLVTGLWTGGCMFLLSMVGSLWMLYLTGFLMGAMSSTCVALCANVIVQQAYYGPQASGILGGVMAGSGVGGMIFSIVIPNCMANFGWQRAMQVMGILWLGMLWLAALLLGKQSGLSGGKGNGAVGIGMTRAEALKSPKLYLQMVLIVIITACCGVQQQLPSLLSTHRYDEAAVSLMISVMTAFLAIGKVAQGLLYGKLGVRKGGVLMLLVFAAGFLTLIWRSLAWPGLLLLSFGLGIYTTLLPQLTRRVFGSREYAAIWALIATVGNAGTFLANPVWGMVYDMTGAYTLGLIAAPVLLVVATVAMLLSLKDS